MIQLPLGTYLILWYDAKMVNYINLIKFIEARKLATVRIAPYLLVDKQDQAENVSKIRDQSQDQKLRSQIQVALTRELSEEEQLLLSFSGEE